MLFILVYAALTAGWGVTPTTLRPQGNFSGVHLVYLPLTMTSLHFIGLSPPLAMNEQPVVATGGHTQFFLVIKIWLLHLRAGNPDRNRTMGCEHIYLPRSPCLPSTHTYLFICVYTINYRKPGVFILGTPDILSSGGLS